jgi:hypothetical protein
VHAETLGTALTAPRVWDALFDETRGGHTNTPEELGPILHEELGVQPRPPKKP